MKTAPPPAAQTSISSKSRLAALSAWTSRRITPPRLKLAVPEAEKNPRYSKNRNSRTSTVWSQESWLSQSPSPQASTTTFPAHQEPEPERRVRKESTCSSVLSESEWYDPPDQPQEALHPVHQVRNSLVPPRDLRRANSTGSSRSSTRSSKGLQTIRRVSEPLTPQPHLLLSLRAVNRSLPPTPNAETASIRDSPNIQIGQEKDDQTEKRRRRAGQRQEAIRELVATEASFAQDAVVTCTIYKACAEGKSPSEICSAIQNTFGRVPEMPLACSYYPWSAQEVRDIFLNIEDLASFSEAFAGILDAASGKEYGINSDDTLGTSMLDMLPRMQSLFQPYVEKHDGALQRLDSMSGSNLDAYAQVTRTLASGLTQSWDLNALLIKPVQRCVHFTLYMSHTDMLILMSV